jgi:hypothetical protein
MMWRVSWQDYRGWRTADLVQPRPELHVADFASKAEADIVAASHRLAGLTVCVSPTPDPKRGSPRIRFPEPDLPTVPPADRRLTP